VSDVFVDVIDSR